MKGYEREQVCQTGVQFEQTAGGNLKKGVLSRVFNWRPVELVVV